MASNRGSGTCLNKLSNFEKTLLSISVLLLLTLVLVILFGISFRGYSSNVSDDSVCISKGCIETAGKMQSMMDFDIDQCSDFYSFSCGGYSRNALSNSAAQASVDSVMDQLRKVLETPRATDRRSVKNLKDLYNSCMNAKSYPDHPEQVFGNVTAEVGMGSWPSLDRFFDFSQVTVEERLVALSLLGIDVAFRWEIVPNPGYPGNYTIKLFPGRPTSKSDDKKKIPNLRTYLENILTLLGVEGSASEMNDIISVEIYFNEIWKGIECRSSALIFPPKESMDEMNLKIPKVNWNVVMRGLWQGVDLTGPFSIEVHCYEKIRDYAIALLDSLGERTVFNYLGWRFLDLFSNQLGPKFLKFHQIYEMNEQGSLSPMFQTQGQYCLGLLEHYAGPLLAEIMTNEFVDKQVIDQVDSMTQDIKASLEQFIGSRAWINGSVAERLLQKVKRVKFQVPSVNANHTHKLFSEFKVDNVFIRNIINLQKKKVAQTLRKNIDGEDNASFGSLSVISRGEKINSNSEILDLYLNKIPSAFELKDQPSSLIYGKLGTFLSRQLSRFLLEQNVSNFPNDPVQLWELWSRSVESSSCIFDKFSFFKMERNDSLLLKKEILVDYISSYLSHSLFKKHEAEEKSLPGFELQRDQMFFLAFAQTLCERKDIFDDRTDIPIDKRVNSAFGNLESFSTTFGCASATLMNPSIRCHL